MGVDDVGPVNGGESMMYRRSTSELQLLQGGVCSVACLRFWLLANKAARCGGILE